MIEVGPDCEPLELSAEDGHFLPTDWPERREDGSVVLSAEQASRLAFTVATLIGHARCE